MPEICDGSDRLRHGSQSVTVSMAPFDVVTAKHDFFVQPSDGQSYMRIAVLLPC